MGGDLDPEMQRIIDNAAEFKNQDGHMENYSYPSREPRSTDWTYIAGSRPLMQEKSSINDAHRAPFDRPAPSFQAINTAAGQSRLSFVPQDNIYSRQESEPRTLGQADNHFRFAQNLRQGGPTNQPKLRPTATQTKDAIGELANAMLMQQPMMRKSSEGGLGSLDFLNDLPQPRPNPLKASRQQITPPFNLSGFNYSPTTKQTSEASSPLVGQHSSPTTRVSIRREANRRAPPPHFPSVEKSSEEYSTDPQTPRQYLTSPSTHPSQTLTLGRAPPTANGIQLISPHELPDRIRQVFPYELFNAVQSKCFSAIYRTNDNVVISAPTGSGKTALFELAICKLVETYSSSQFKIVYQAPTKALCSERLRDWQKKFSHLNLPCAELTGDTTQTEMGKVRNASIIITTPEKWDSITRKWADHHKLVSLVKLMLIDEVHILKDVRGATLEAVVSRMKAMGTDVRFIALSATVPNSRDIAIWLGRDHTNQHLPAHQETFGEGFRPVKLQKHIHGFDGMMNDFAFEKVLDGKLIGLIAKYTQKKPIMVFCFTRKSCENTAALLAEWWLQQRPVDRAWHAPIQRVTVSSKELSNLIPSGVAYHHAGLDPQDRHAVETGYLKGDINVICCTSTLAVGINLPCHMVILKGTISFQDGLLSECSDLEVMQMLGRAGRPQFDDSAVAIIMTRVDKVDRYKRMVSGQDVLESTLHLNLIEHLNSEISLGSIKDLYGAKKWLSGTFLSVRMRENPNHYKIADISPDGDTDRRLEQVCERDIKLLQEYSLVSSTERISCTEYGDAMSRYMVQFETMKLLLSIPKRAKTEQILQVICQASEFKDLRMKPQERPFLREFNKSPFIKFPIKENITLTPHKVSLMIQVQLGGIDLPVEKEFNSIRRQYMTEKSLIFERIQRLIRCVIDCKVADCDAVSTKHALDLARSLSAEYWEYSNLQLRQIPNIGPVAVRKLVSQNINTLEKLSEAETATIERYLSKNPPYGKRLKDSLASFPWLKLDVEIVGEIPFKQGKKPVVHVKAKLGYKNEKIPTWQSRRPLVIFMAETKHEGTLVHFWRGNVTRLENGGYDLKFTVELSSPDEEVRCWLSCEEIVGTVQTMELKHDIPASRFPLLSPNVNIKNLSDDIEKPTKVRNSDDEYGGDDLQDDEMLAAVKNVENDENDEGYYDSDDFVDIDDVNLQPTDIKTKKFKAASEFLEPFQMANGKWTCSHHCRDGGLLKNGQKCKHQCCREGLDKPPKLKRKSSISLGPISVKKPSDGPSIDIHRKKSQKSSAKTRDRKKKSSHTRPSAPSYATFQSGDQSDFEINTEAIDLAEQLSPVPYEKLAPREYRKLHSLHTSVQKEKDKAIRLPKKTPEFSYAVGVKPELNFLTQGQGGIEDYDLDQCDDNDEFPPASSLIVKEDETPGNEDDQFEAGCMDYEPFNGSHGISFHNDSSHATHTVIYAHSDPFVQRQPSPAPKVTSSFANRIFDFDAFSDKMASMDQPVFNPKLAAPLETTPCTDRGIGEPMKRVISPGPEISEAKHRRVTQEETAAAVTLQQLSSTPAWVNELESSFINDLKDCVEFI